MFPAALSTRGLSLSVAPTTSRRMTVEARVMWKSTKKHTRTRPKKHRPSDIHRKPTNYPEPPSDAPEEYKIVDSYVGGTYEDYLEVVKAEEAKAEAEGMSLDEYSAKNFKFFVCDWATGEQKEIPPEVYNAESMVPSK